MIRHLQFAATCGNVAAVWAIASLQPDWTPIAIAAAVAALTGGAISFFARW